MIEFKDKLLLKNLSLARGGRVLIDGLNLNLLAGDSIAITGANGTGKSSLLRAIAGLIPHLGGVERAENLHYAGHHDPVKAHLSVEENLKFWCDFENSPLSGLETVGIARIKHVMGGVLSAGQKRRLTLARLIAIPRSLWLLDEPTAALDAGGCALLDQLIENHCSNGGIVMVATHQKIASLKQEICL